MAAVLDGRAWGVSVAVHAAGVALVAALLGAGHRHRVASEPPPARLVWFEPVAPLVGSPDAPAAAAPVAVPAAPAPRPEAPASSVPVRRPAPAVPDAPPVRQPRARREPRPAARRATLPEAEADRAAASASTAAPTVSRGEPVGAASGDHAGSVASVGDAVVPVGTVATPPELLARVMPQYPARARDLGVEGQVLLEVVVDRAGRPEPEIKVRRSVALLDAAAIAAVRQWRFRPARDAAGKPVRVIMDVPVRFELR